MLFYKMLEREGRFDFITNGVVKEKTIQFLVDNSSIVEDTKVEVLE